MERYADFHSLRCTLGSYPRRNEVNSRTAMDLVYHSERNLKGIFYTNSTLLQTGEVNRNFHDDKILTEY